jgi:hypothetical protein
MRAPATLPPRPASPLRPARPAGRSRGRFWDRPIRNTVLAASSMLVVAIAAIFLVASAGTPAISFRLLSYSIPGSSEIVYGKVAASSGKGVVSATVEEYWTVSGHVYHLRRQDTNAAGLFRVVLPPLTDQAVDVTVTKVVNGTVYVGRTTIEVSSGHAYDVSAQLGSHGALLFLPVGSY